MPDRRIPDKSWKPSDIEKIAHAWKDTAGKLAREFTRADGNCVYVRFGLSMPAACVKAGGVPEKDQNGTTYTFPDGTKIGCFTKSRCWYRHAT